MLKKVRNWIDTHKLLAKGDKVLVACSGGPDSLALLYILYDLQTDYDMQIAVAHVDHMFRGQESAEDAAFVGQTCRNLGIEFYRTAIDVPRYIRETGRSTEDAARFLRYEYLRHIAKSTGKIKIATGHNRNDQAETVLINLLRGAGGAGLAGMQPVENDIIRPLLDLSRQEIEAYCTQNKLKPRVDSTNAQKYYTRNRIRLELLPKLAQYNPNVKEALCRTAVLVGDEHAFIHQYALKIWSDVITEENGKIIIDNDAFKHEHIAVKRELLRTAIEKKRGNLKGITFFHVEQLLEMLLHKQVGSIMTLPGGLVAQKGYSTLELENKVLGNSSSGSAVYPGFEIAIPGTTEILEMGIAVTAEILDTEPCSDKYSAVFDLAALRLPIYVRTRLEGDSFCPSGMQGHKKLKDFFIDAKVLREKRDFVPIFADGLGIIWVGGYRRSEYGKVSPLTEQFLQLTIFKQGDL